MDPYPVQDQLPAQQALKSPLCTAVASMQGAPVMMPCEGTVLNAMSISRGLVLPSGLVASYFSYLQQSRPVKLQLVIDGKSASLVRGANMAAATIMPCTNGNSPHIGNDSAPDCLLVGGIAAGLCQYAGHIAVGMSSSDGVHLTLHLVSTFEAAAAASGLVDAAAAAAAASSEEQNGKLDDSAVMAAHVKPEAVVMPCKDILQMCDDPVVLQSSAYAAGCGASQQSCGYRNGYLSKPVDSGPSAQASRKRSATSAISNSSGNNGHSSSAGRAETLMAVRNADCSTTANVQTEDKIDTPDSDPSELAEVTEILQDSGVLQPQDKPSTVLLQAVAMACDNPPVAAVPLEGSYAHIVDVATVCCATAAAAAPARLGAGQQANIQPMKCSMIADKQQEQQEQQQHLTQAKRARIMTTADYAASGSRQAIASPGVVVSAAATAFEANASAAAGQSSSDDDSPLILRRKRKAADTVHAAQHQSQQQQEQCIIEATGTPLLKQQKQDGSIAAAADTQESTAAAARAAAAQVEDSIRDWTRHEVLTASGKAEHVHSNSASQLPLPSLMLRSAFPGQKCRWLQLMFSVYRDGKRVAGPESCLVYGQQHLKPPADMLCGVTGLKVTCFKTAAPNMLQMHVETPNSASDNPTAPAAEACLPAQMLSGHEMKAAAAARTASAAAEALAVAAGTTAALPCSDCYSSSGSDSSRSESRTSSPESDVSSSCSSPVGKESSSSSMAHSKQQIQRTGCAQELVHTQNSIDIVFAGEAPNEPQHMMDRVRHNQQCTLTIDPSAHAPVTAVPAAANNLKPPSAIVTAFATYIINEKNLRSLSCAVSCSYLPQLPCCMDLNIYVDSVRQEQAAPYSVVIRAYEGRAGCVVTRGHVTGLNIYLGYQVHKWTLEVVSQQLSMHLKSPAVVAAQATGRSAAMSAMVAAERAVSRETWITYKMPLLQGKFTYIKQEHAAQLVLPLKGLLNKAFTAVQPAPMPLQVSVFRDNKRVAGPEICLVHAKQNLKPAAGLLKSVMACRLLGFRAAPPNMLQIYARSPGSAGPSADVATAAAATGMKSAAAVRSDAQAVRAATAGTTAATADTAAVVKGALTDDPEKTSATIAIAAGAGMKSAAATTAGAVRCVDKAAIKQQQDSNDPPDSAAVATAHERQGAKPSTDANTKAMSASRQAYTTSRLQKQGIADHVMPEGRHCGSRSRLQHKTSAIKAKQVSASMSKLDNNSVHASAVHTKAATAAAEVAAGRSAALMSAANRASPEHCRLFGAVQLLSDSPASSGQRTKVQHQSPRLSSLLDNVLCFGSSSSPHSQQQPGASRPAKSPRLAAAGGDDTAAAAIGSGRCKLQAACAQQLQMTELATGGTAAIAKQLQATVSADKCMALQQGVAKQPHEGDSRAEHAAPKAVGSRPMPAAFRGCCCVSSGHNSIGQVCHDVTAAIAPSSKKRRTTEEGRYVGQLSAHQSTQAPLLALRSPLQPAATKAANIVTNMRLRTTSPDVIMLDCECTTTIDDCTAATQAIQRSKTIAFADAKKRPTSSTAATTAVDASASSQQLPQFPSKVLQPDMLGIHVPTPWLIAALFPDQPLSSAAAVAAAAALLPHAGSKEPVQLGLQLVKLSKQHEAAAAIAAGMFTPRPTSGATTTVSAAALHVAGLSSATTCESCSEELIVEVWPVLKKSVVGTSQATNSPTKLAAWYSLRGNVITSYLPSHFHGWRVVGIAPAAATMLTGTSTAAGSAATATQSQQKLVVQLLLLPPGTTPLDDNKQQPQQLHNYQQQQFHARQAKSGTAIAPLHMANTTTEDHKAKRDAGRAAVHELSPTSKKARTVTNDQQHHTGPQHHETTKCMPANNQVPAGLAGTTVVGTVTETAAPLANVAVLEAKCISSGGAAAFASQTCQQPLVQQSDCSDRPALLQVQKAAPTLHTDASSNAAASAADCSNVSAAVIADNACQQQQRGDSREVIQHQQMSHHALCQAIQQEAAAAAEECDVISTTVTSAVAAQQAGDRKATAPPAAAVLVRSSYAQDVNGDFVASQGPCISIAQPWTVSGGCETDLADASTLELVQPVSEVAKMEAAVQQAQLADALKPAEVHCGTMTTSATDSIREQATASMLLLPAVSPAPLLSHATSEDALLLAAPSVPVTSQPTTPPEAPVKQTINPAVQSEAAAAAKQVVPGGTTARPLLHTANQAELTSAAPTLGMLNGLTADATGAALMSGAALVQTVKTTAAAAAAVKATQPHHMASVPEPYRAALQLPATLSMPIKQDDKAVAVSASVQAAQPLQGAAPAKVEGVVNATPVVQPDSTKLRLTASTVPAATTTVAKAAAVYTTAQALGTVASDEQTAAVSACGVSQTTSSAAALSTTTAIATAHTTDAPKSLAAAAAQVQALTMSEAVVDTFEAATASSAMPVLLPAIAGLAMTNAVVKVTEVSAAPEAAQPQHDSTTAAAQHVTMLVAGTLPGSAHCESSATVTAVSAQAGLPRTADLPTNVLLYITPPSAGSVPAADESVAVTGKARAAEAPAIQQAIQPQHNAPTAELSVGLTAACSAAMSSQPTATALSTHEPAAEMAVKPLPSVTKMPPQQELEAAAASGSADCGRFSSDACLPPQYLLEHFSSLIDAEQKLWVLLGEHLKASDELLERLELMMELLGSSTGGPPDKLALFQMHYKKVQTWVQRSNVCKAQHAVLKMLGSIVKDADN